MKEAMVQLFGAYAPVDGCADWSYIAGVLVFAICLYSLFRILGAVFKR